MSTRNSSGPSKASKARRSGRHFEECCLQSRDVASSISDADSDGSVGGLPILVPVPACRGLQELGRLTPRGAPTLLDEVRTFHATCVLRKYVLARADREFGTYSCS